MTDDDRRLRDLADISVEVVDDLLDAEPGERARVAALRLDPVGLPRPLGDVHLVALLLEVLLEVLPAARGKPRTVDKDDLLLHDVSPHRHRHPTYGRARRRVLFDARATLAAWRHARSSAISAV